MKVFSTAQIKEIDQYTVLHEPISSIALMERASQVFSTAFKSFVPNPCRVVVFAGPGNNGGDALAVSRLLLQDGYEVETFLFNPKANLSQECEVNKRRLLHLENAKFTEVKDAFSPPVLGEKDVIIDGLFGIGLNEPLTGGFAAVVRYINKSGARVVSIDIPSGLFGENNVGNDPEAIVHANKTFTFGFPKLAFFLADNEPYVGEWEVLDILHHPHSVAKIPTSVYIIDKLELKNIFKQRCRFAHKGDFGHALLIAGSYGRMGAAVLSAKACLKSGAGLLTTHIPEKGNLVMQSVVPEAMVSMDNADHFIQVPDLDKYDVVGIGPGIGLAGETVLALQEILVQSDKPLVLDADALNIISQNKHLLNEVPEGSILTPHPKELDRLAGESSSSYERLQKAINLASEKKCYVVLKGAYTAVCTPDEGCYFNITGNPGMATAGSGDVLTGIILGLLSQGYTSRDAAMIGVYIHGLAGDIAAAEGSQESLIAGDIIRNIGLAFKEAKP